jgi:hypothetical protein
MRSWAPLVWWPCREPGTGRKGSRWWRPRCSVQRRSAKQGMQLLGPGSVEPGTARAKLWLLPSAALLLRPAAAAFTRRDTCASHLPRRRPRCRCSCSRAPRPLLPACALPRPATVHMDRASSDGDEPQPRTQRREWKHGDETNQEAYACSQPWPSFRLKKISTRWIVPLSSYLANIVQSWTNEAQKIHLVISN